MLTDFKDEDFDSKIKNEDISVIQFSAAWCGPCKTLKPIMDKLANEYKGKAGFYYADIEDGGINTGSAAGIRGVPTVIIYKKGVEVDRKVGGVPESQMKEFLEKNFQFKLSTSPTRYNEPTVPKYELLDLIAIILIASFMLSAIFTSG